ncbi:MAG: T9SS type A sorting domain-containing protein [Chitinophagales bacterium]
MKRIPFLLLVLAPLFASAQATLIKSDVFGYDYIENLNGKLLFFATGPDEPYNYELWVSDGTEAGTMQLLDINGISDGSILGNAYWGPAYTDKSWTIYNNELYFIAADLTHGLEIWKTDGTAAGTGMLKDIYPGFNGFSTPEIFFPYFTELDGKLYFSANDGVHGWELWVTDGSEAGTHMVIDISTDAYYGSNPEHLINFNGQLVFTARDDVYGLEVFISDGTAVGTHLLKDIIPGAYGSMNDGYAESIDPLFTVSGSYLYFVAHTEFVFPLTNDLYRTDGTEAGTIQLKTGLSDYTNFTDVNDQLFFYAFDGDYYHSGLWKSNGTPGGTTQVSETGDVAFSSEGHSFYAFDNTLFAYAYSSDFTQYGLGRSDGTTGGTTLVNTFEGLASVPEVYNFIADAGSDDFFFHVLKKVDAGSMSVRMCQSNGTTNGIHVFNGVRPFRSTVFKDGALYFLGIDTTADETYGLYRIDPVTLEGGGTGVPESASDQPLTVFPDPASTFMQVQNGMSADAVCVFYDMQGKLLLQKKILAHATAQIDVSAWTEGLYLCTILSGAEQQSQHFVIVH